MSASYIHTYIRPNTYIPVCTTHSEVPAPAHTHTHYTAYTVRTTVPSIFVRFSNTWFLRKRHSLSCSIPKPSKARQGKVSGILSSRAAWLRYTGPVFCDSRFPVARFKPFPTALHCTPHQKLLCYTRNPYFFDVRFSVLYRALYCRTRFELYSTAQHSVVTRLQLHVTLGPGLIPTAATGISKRLTSPGSPHLTSAFRALYGTAPRPIG
jgi:hypothetical protein